MRPVRGPGKLDDLLLAPADAPAEQQQAVLQHLARTALPSISLHTRDRQLLAYVGDPLPQPAHERRACRCRSWPRWR